MTPLPEGWTVVERPDNVKIQLTREFGDEAIQVNFVAREDVSPWASLRRTGIQCPSAGSCQGLSCCQVHAKFGGSSS